MTTSRCAKSPRTPDSLTALNWKQLTGGAGTLSGIPLDLGLGTALGVAMVVVAVAFWYQGSPWGLRLRASREEEVAARAAGVGIELERGIAFVLSAAIMGVGGCLYAHQQGVLTPNGFFLGLTFLTLAMLTIGGTRGLSGAVVGTFVIAAVQEVFRRLASGGEGIGPIDLGLPAGTAPAFIAALMLLVMARRPEGSRAGASWATGFAPGHARRRALRSVCGRFGAVNAPAAKLAPTTAG